MKFLKKIINFLDKIWNKIINFLDKIWKKISYFLYGDNKNVCDKSTKFY
jgi:hypothetical protein